MKTKIPFNINNYIEFTLSERGAHILNEHNRYMSNRFPNHSRKIDYMQGDTYRDQFWSVMHIFADEGMQLGYEVFCEDCIINFEV